MQRVSMAVSISVGPEDILFDRQSIGRDSLSLNGLETQTVALVMNERENETCDDRLC